MALLALAPLAARADDWIINNGASETLSTSDVTTGAVIVGSQGSGTLTISSTGALTMDTTDGSTASRIELGNGGNGTLNIDGGTVTFNIAGSASAPPTSIGRLWVGGGVGNTTGGTGTVNMSSGLLDYVPVVAGTQNYGGLAIGRGPGVTGNFNQSGGTVEFQSIGAVDLGTQGGTGTYALSGNAAFDSSNGGVTMYVGSRTSGGGGSGTASQGVLHISDDAQFTLTTGTNPGSQFYVGDAKATGTVIQDGAGSVVTLGTTNPIQFGTNVNGTAGANGGGTGSYQLSAGTLNVLNPGGAAEIAFGAADGGSGTFDISGGTANVATNLIVAQTAGSTGNIHQTGGTLSLTGSGRLSFGAGNGSYDLLGGKLLVGGTNGISGPGTMTFGNATLGVQGSNLTTSTAATLSTGTSFTFDTQGLGATWSGVLSGGGSLVKAGAGTLTLTAANTYTGSTTISAGTLALTGAGSIASSSGLTDNGVFDISGVTTGTSLASLSGSGTVLTGTKALTVGTNNADSSFSGTITNTNNGWDPSYGTFTKTGTGTLTLDGATIQNGESYVTGGAIAQTSGNTTVSYLAVGSGTTSGSPNVGALNVTGGTISFGTGLQVGDFGGTGTVTQTGGTVVVSAACGDTTHCANFNIGNQGGTGTYNISGGTLQLSNGSFDLGRNTDGHAASTGTLNLSGSGVVSVANGPFVIGDWVAGTGPAGTGTVNQTGGTLTIGSDSGLYLSGRGAGAYNFSGGTLQIGGNSLNGSYNNFGGAYAFNLGGGTIQVTGAALTTGVNATLVSDTTSTIDTNGLGASWSGVLSGGGALHKTGAGSLTLSGANSYAGGTTLDAGSLIAGNASALGAGRLTMAAGTTLGFNGNYSLGNAITISGDPTFDVGSGLTDTLTGVISDGSTPGDIVKTGAGKLVLTAVNSYTGSTTISGGTLALTGAGSIASSSGLIDNGTFDISGVTTGTSLANLSGSGTVLTGTKALTVGTDNRDSSFSGTITNTNNGWDANYGTFTKAGTGTLTLNGATIQNGESYVTGGAIAQTAGNTNISYLSVGVGTTSGAPNTGALNVSGGTLTFGTGLQVGDFGGTGTVTQTGGNVIVEATCGDLTHCSTFNIGNQGGSGSYNISGGTLSLNTGHFDIGRNDDSHAPSTGTLNLSGSGAVSVNNGEFVIGDWLGGTGPAGTGTVNQTGGSLTIGSTSTLYLAGRGNGTYDLSGGSLQIGGASLQGSYNNFGGSYAFNLGGGTIQVTGSALTTSVQATLVSGTTSTIDTNGLGASWSGIISGAGAMDKEGAGSLTLSGANSYSGGTALDTGSLIAGNATALGSGRLTMASGTTLGFGGSYSLANAITASGNSTIDVGSGLTGTLSGVIGNGGAPANIVKTGGGILGLTNIESYTGSTTISAGTLTLSGSGSIAASSGLTDNGVFDIAGTTSGASLVSLAGNGTVTLGAKTLTLSNASGSFAGSMNGTGGLTLSSGSETLTGSNGYSGATLIAGGTLLLSGAGSIAASSGVTDNGTFNIAGTTAGASIASLAGSGTVVLGAKTLTLTNAGGSFAGSIGGTGGLTLAGGSETLSGGSNYSGGTRLNAGSLTVANASALGTGALAMADSTTLNFGSSLTLANAVSVSGDPTINVNAGLTDTLSGVISDGGTPGDLVKTGAGKLVLSAANSYSGATTISAGTLALSGAGAIAASSGLTDNGIFDISGTSGGASIASLAGTGTVALGTRSLTLTNAAGSFAGSIGGSGGLSLTAGSETLSGSNGYTGATVIAGGTLALSGAGSIAASSGVTDNGGFDISATTSGASVASLSGSGTVTLGNRILTLTSPAGSFAGSIGGAGGLTLLGGSQILTGTNSYTGITTIAGGSLQLGSGGTTGSIAGDVLDSGALIFNRSNDVTFNGVIAGSGAVSQIGTGSVTLTAANSYTGATTISAGRLALSGAGSIAASSGLVDNGSFDISATTSGASIKTLSGNGSIALGSKTLTLTNAAGNFAGAIGGTGGLILAGGSETLSGASSYSGGTSLNTGRLVVANDGALGSGTLAMAGGTTLDFSGSHGIGNAITLSGTPTVNVATGLTETLGGVIGNGGTPGALVKTGAGKLVLTAANSYSGGTTVAGGSLQLGAGGSGGSVIGNITDNGALIFNRSDDIAFNGAVSGTGSLTQAGPGSLTLTAVNSYTGSTTISAGTLALTGTGSIAASSGLEDDGIFDISGTSAGASIASLSGDGIVRLGAQYLTLTNATGNFAGSIGGTGGVIQASGTQTFSGANSYTGGTRLDAGTLVVANTGALGSGTLVMAEGTTLGFAGDNVTISNAIVIAGDPTFDVGAGMTDTISGVISDGGTPGDVVKTGAGVLVLTADNTYTGSTTILGGTLALAGAGGIADSSGLTDNAIFDISATDAGASITSLSGNGQVNLGAKSLTLTNAGGTFAGGIGGSGGLVLAGGSETLTGSNSFTGATTISAGTQLALAGSGSIAASSGVTDNGSFDISATSAGVSIASLSGAGTVDLGAKSLTLTNAQGNFAGAIGGSGGLVLAGGKEILTGDNSYTGGTTISAGTLQIGNGGTSGSITGDVVDNGAAIVSRSDDVSFGGLISGSGSLTQAGPGSLALTAVNSYTGSTVISGGTLALTGNGSIAASSGLTDLGVFDIAGTSAGASIKSLSGNGAVALGEQSLTLTDAQGNFAGSIGGTGGLILAGGSETLSGASSYSGGTSLTAGSLILGNAGALGTGGLDMAAGTTLGFSNSLTLGNAITVSGDPTVAVATGLTDTLSGVISDGTAPGDIVKTGGGKLVLTAANSFTGSTTISAGTLALSGAGSIAPSSGLTDNGIFDISAADADAAITSLSGSGQVNLGARSLTLSDAGGSFAGSIGGSGGLTLAGGNETLTGSSSYTGGTRILGGVLTGTAASFGSGAILDNAALVIDQGSDAGFANAIDGTGSFIKSGAGALNLTGTSALAGPTTIAGGELAVNGSLANSLVTAESGTTLSGSGTVGGVAADSGSNIAPGNGGIGKMSVTANFVQAGGSTYQVQLAPGSNTSDLIAVTGTAGLGDGAILDVAKSEAGPYTIGSQYTVLTAAGGLSGVYTLTGDTKLSSFIGLTPVYDANNVFLDVTQVRNLVDAGETLNQIATAGGLDSLPDDNTLRGALLNLPTDAQARNAFDQLSGEVDASVKTSLIDDSRFAREAATDRLRQAFGALGGANSSIQTAALGGTAAPDRGVVWGQGFGSWGNVDGDGDAATLDRSISGMFIGADTAVAAGWRAGVFGGYSQSSFSVDSRNSTGTTSSYDLGLYGGNQWGNLGLRFGAAYGWNNITTSRSVAFTGYTDSLGAGYQAGTAQVFGDLGYRIDAGVLSLEPFLGLAYVHLTTDGFTEQGGDAALTSQSDSTSSTFSTLGLRAATPFSLGGVGLTASGTIGWRHAYGSVTPSSTLSFGGGDSFTVDGVPIARNLAVLGAGISTPVSPDVTFGINYSGQVGGGTVDQGISGNLDWRF